MIKIGWYGTVEIEQNFRGFNREVLVPKTIEVLNELEDYWPLTLRQVYYRLVAAQIIENHLNQYKSLSVLLTKLRRLNIVPWEVIEDRTRRISDKRGWPDSKKFAEYELEQFLRSYDRCLVQNQENHVEIFVEKDALATIFKNVAWPYCVRVITCKGQVSATYIKSYAERAQRAIDNGQNPVILHYGDLDPTGARIPVAIENNLWKHHEVDVDLHVIALTPDQVKKYKLPHSIDALKKKDPNYKWFVRNFGEMAVELDALHPEALKELIRAGLNQVLDLEDMVQQQKIEKRERAKLEKAKERILEVITKEKLI
jgi:hypothetical protein